MAAARTSSLQVGVIAEDETDGQTLRTLIKRLRGSETKVLTRSDNGCSAIPRKGARWVNDLVRSGCDAIIVVHDLDRDPNGQLRSEAVLRGCLLEITGPDRRRHVCIPIEELEAWFWADPKVLELVARRPMAAAPHPERLRQPKEALIKLSRDAGRKPRYATNDNPKLAEVLDLGLCAQRCPAFHALRDFVQNL